MYRAALKNIEAETARRTQKIFAVGVCLEQTADQGYIFVCRSNKAYSLRTVFTIGQRNQDLAAALTRSWKIATAPSSVAWFYLRQRATFPRETPEVEESGKTSRRRSPRNLRKSPRRVECCAI